MSDHDQPKLFFAPLLWTMVTILLTTARPGQCDVTCEAGHFYAGGPGKVTCNFGKDVSGPTKHNFNIIQYRTLQSEENYILLCNWSPQDLECTIKNGYSFDKSTVSDTLVLNIPNLQVSMGGIYVCHLVPADDRVPVDTCQLNVTEPPTTPEAPTTPIPPTTPTHPTTPATTTSNNKTIVPVANKHDAGDSGGDNTGVIVAVVFAVLIVIVVVAVTWIVFRRKYVAKRRQETQTGSEHQDGWKEQFLCIGPPGSPKNRSSVESPTEEAADNAENDALLSNANTNETICKAETPNACREVNEVDVGKGDVGANVDVDVSERLAEYRAEGKANEGTQPQLAPATNTKTDETKGKAEYPNTNSKVNEVDEERKDVVGGDGVAGDGGMGKVNQTAQPQLRPATNATDAANNEKLLELRRGNERLRHELAQRNSGQPMSVHSTQPGAHTTVNEDVTDSKPSIPSIDKADSAGWLVGGQGEVNKTTQPQFPPTTTTIAAAANDSQAILDHERQKRELQHQGHPERRKLDLQHQLEFDRKRNQHLFKGTHATPPGTASTAGSAYNPMAQAQKTTALGSPLSTTTVSSGYPVSAPYTVSSPPQGSSQFSSNYAPGLGVNPLRNDLPETHGVGGANVSTAGSSHNSTATISSPHTAQVSPQGRGQVLNQPRNDLPQTHGIEGAGLNRVNVDTAPLSQPVGSMPIQTMKDPPVTESPLPSSIVGSSLDTPSSQVPAAITSQPPPLSMSAANNGSTSGQFPSNRPVIQPSKFQQPLYAPVYGTTQPDPTIPQPVENADPPVPGVSTSEYRTKTNDSDDEGAVESPVNTLTTEDAPDYQQPLDTNIEKEFNLDIW